MRWTSSRNDQRWPVWVSFLIVVAEYLTKQLQGGRAHFGIWWEGGSHHDREVTGTRAQGSWAHTLSQEWERDGRWCPAHFLLFIQSGIPTQGMVLATTRVGLPISVNVIKMIPHGLVQRCALLGPMKLRININHHSYLETRTKICTHPNLLGQLDSH